MTPAATNHPVGVTVCCAAMEPQGQKTGLLRASEHLRNFSVQVQKSQQVKELGSKLNKPQSFHRGQNFFMEGP